MRVWTVRSTDGPCAHCGPHDGRAYAVYHAGWHGSEIVRERALQGAARATVTTPTARRRAMARPAGSSYVSYAHSVAGRPRTWKAYDVPRTENEECPGHESLRGDLMGAAFYCDGTCTSD
jgi:hypothetical protein